MTRAISASGAQPHLPVVRTRMKSGGTSLNRYLVPFLTAIAVLALSVMLVVTIYYTLLDLQWLAFLLGVLFAAILSMVTQSLKAQWRLVRRTAQLQRQKELLAEETARGERAEQALKIAELRFQTVRDELLALSASRVQPILEPEISAPKAIQPRPPEAAGEAAYLDAMERELTTDKNPREYLLRAIEEDQFILLEQRIEPLTAQGQPNLREVLLRLQEEHERMLPPGGFFEVAERYDLMPAIDRWVVRKLLKSCAAMKSADRSWRMPLYCVNLSGATLRDRGFTNHVRAQLQHWELAGNRLCFEIHHGAFAEQESDIAILMERLKPLGCRFTVDGFGSHKVSFTPFRQLRFDYLKIDGSIISQVLSSNAELTKVKAIVLACRKIGVGTVAQFVEDDATRAKLKEVGVDYVQGFGIEKPGPLAVMAPMAGHLVGSPA